jgi:hypothetical protein
MSDTCLDVPPALGEPAWLPVAALGSELSERTAIQLVAVIRQWLEELRRSERGRRSTG